MKTSDTAALARALFDAHGDKAEAEAAQKASAAEEGGHAEEAEAWRAVRMAIKEIRGARAT